jgi:S1-C subfamily serine protease
MDFREVFSDDELRDEFLDRFDELSRKVTGEAGDANRALESLDSLDSLDSVPSTSDPPSKDAARSAVEHMREGTYGGSDPVLEAIIERFTRPVYLVQDSQFHRPQDFEDSEQIAQRLHTARPVVQPTIPSVGRIDLRNSRSPWVGTGWVVRPGIVATNAHVAETFAGPSKEGFAFKQHHYAPPVAAALDWRHEFDRLTESRFRVREVLWIEPSNSADVALLRIADRGENDEEQPPPLPLMTASDLRLGMWVSVIGYPDRNPFNNLAAQQRIFDGIYEVKRLAPGKVTSLNAAQGLLDHDATTLSGNSGSAVVDLESGRVAAIHFGGVEGQSNHAVQAPRLAEIVKTRAG